MKKTLRSHLNTQFKRFYLSMIPFLAWPFILSYFSELPAYLSGIVFMIFFIYVLFSIYWSYCNFKCPKCKIVLFALLSCKKGLDFNFGVSEDIKCCPGCALSLDEPIEIET